MEQKCKGSECEGVMEDGYCKKHSKLGSTADSEEDKKESLDPDISKALKILDTFLVSLHKISEELEPAKVAEKIIQETCSLLTCERATLFYVDQNELVSLIAKGAKNIKLPKGKGIAGDVATNGKLANVPNPREDKRFESKFDQDSGFMTRNILAAPIRDKDRDAPIGVLECLNKSVGSFTAQDEVLMTHLAAHIGVALRQSQLYEVARRAEQKSVSLVEIVQLLHSNPNINALIFALSTRTHQLVDADRCTLYLVDRARSQLVVMQGDADIRIPLSKGIAGHVATSGEIVNIKDCYQDKRFNKAVDRKTGYRTRSMLCMPIIAETEVIGVLQLINKLDEPVFGPSDESILEVLLNIAGPILKKSSLFLKRAPNLSPQGGGAFRPSSASDAQRRTVDKAGPSGASGASGATIVPPKESDSA